jgi:hypothetical protein
LPCGVLVGHEDAELLGRFGVVALSRLR